jgi:predicted NodU family carbamoyl transferase
LNQKYGTIVGVSFGYHDASCCISKNGKLITAVQEVLVELKMTSHFQVKAYDTAWNKLTLLK